MGRRLGRFLEDSGAAVVISEVVAMMGGPPPSSSLTLEALIQQVDGSSSDGYGG
jgi:hypothetical protein